MARDKTRIRRNRVIVTWFDECPSSGGSCTDFPVPIDVPLTDDEFAWPPETPPIVVVPLCVVAGP